MSVESIVAAIESVLPPYTRPIGHHDAYLSDIDQLHDDLGRWLQASGRSNYWLLRLENLLCSYCEVPYVIPTNSGTSALHLALLALGIKPNEEVIVPSLTFIATAAAVRYVSAIPHFVDCNFVLNGSELRLYLEQNTVLNPNGRGRLNPNTNRVISAVIAVDLLGFPADFQELELVANEFGLILIEDAAQALGSSGWGQKCGSYGVAAILSFNSNKIVTGHGGGALLTKDPEVAERVRHLSTTARKQHPWRVEHTELGYNYRMSSLTAAVICDQLEQLDTFLEGKKKLRKSYMDALAGSELHPIDYNVNMKPNNWLISFHVTGKLRRDDVFKALHEKGVNARALFTPLHTLPMFTDCPRQSSSMWMCTTWFDAVICLPSGLLLCQ